MERSNLFPDTTNHRVLMADISRDLLGGDMNFPTCLNIAVSIRDALTDPEVTVDHLAKLIGADPLITARILRMANCVTLNPSGVKVVSISNAVARLGFNVVRAVSLVLALEQLTKSQTMAVFAPLSEKIWEHSIQVAALSRILAKRLAVGNADEAMLAGLVSDIGTFYLMYRASTYQAYQQDQAYLMDLLHHFSVSVGGHVIQLLGLPESVVDALKPCGKNLDEPVVCLSDLIYLARKLAVVDGAWSVDEEDCLLPETISELANRYGDLLVDSEDDLREIKTALTH